MTFFARLCLALGLPVAAVAALPAPVETPYPGTIALKVDLSDTAHLIFRSTETIPVHAGALRLLYPKWVPGEHGPTGPIDNLAGLVIKAGGKRLPWRRDALEMYAIDLQVPSGVSALSLEFQFLSPLEGNYGAGRSATGNLVCLEWNQVVFYPDGYASRLIQVSPTAVIPEGWTVVTALESEGTRGTEHHFATTSLEMLVDSPLGAGLNVRTVDIAPRLAPPVRLNILADRPTQMAADDRQIGHFKALVKEATALFGSHHYAHYDFLLFTSDYMTHFGLEHHQSGDDRLEAGFFSDPSLYAWDADLPAHEYVHSWNGKFRRPAGLLTTDFRQPQKTDLLWVYEGLTEYYGYVLAGRAGFHDLATSREAFATLANLMAFRTGRSWRNLQDTTDFAQVLYNANGPWENWRRSTDFYEDGVFLWLDVDTKIRSETGGSRSLDDFCRQFYGGSDGKLGPVPYTEADVFAALNKVVHLDWAGFIHHDLQSNEPLFDGLRRSGWELAYVDNPSVFFVGGENIEHQMDLMASLGMKIDLGDRPGTLLDVLWGGPSFDAGLAPGMQVIGVNDEQFNVEFLRQAIVAAQKTGKPIRLLLTRNGRFLTADVKWNGGPRFPILRRLGDTEDVLAQILAAKR